MSEPIDYEALADEAQRWHDALMQSTPNKRLLWKIHAALRQAAQEIADLQHLRQCRDQWQEQAEHLQDRNKALERVVEAARKRLAWMYAQGQVDLLLRDALATLEARIEETEGE